MQANLDDYLARIDYTGPVAVDVATLTAIHRRHLLSVTYENIDVQLGVPLDTDPHKAFDKIVNRRRGGWCYEMNGLLGWALTEIGFDITPVAGGVARALIGDAALGNHLVLLADLDSRWVVGAGFGDGFIEPLPLREHQFNDRGFNFRLEKQTDGYWRLHNHQFGAAPSFDFNEAPADRDLFARQCQWLQTATDSPFVRALVCQRFQEHGYEIQTGLIAKSVTPTEDRRETIDSFDQFVERLANVFDINLPGPDAARLWERVSESHERHMAGQT